MNGVHFTLTAAMIYALTRFLVCLLQNYRNGGHEFRR
jgi:hypothetical protein